MFLPFAVIMTGIVRLIYLEDDEAIQSKLMRFFTACLLVFYLFQVEFPILSYLTSLLECIISFLFLGILFARFFWHK